MERLVKRDSNGSPYVLINYRKYRPDTAPRNTRATPGVMVTAWDDRYSARVPHSLTLYVAGGTAEKWTTTDPYVPRKTRTKVARPVKPGENQIRIDHPTILVEVAENRVKHNGSKRPKPMYLQCHGADMTREEWDKFVASVNQAWDDVPVQGIVAALQAEVAAEDELLAYIKDRGLA